MAVKSVWGKLNNGSEVVFARAGTDTWSVEVAGEAPDGRYVAEVWAEDFAGNVAYKMAIIWVTKGKVTCLRFIEHKYKCRYVCPINCKTGGTTMTEDKHIKYILGERLPLEFEAYATDGGDFVISNATYKLWRYNKVIDEGPMEIDGHKLSHLFAPDKPGYYLFEVSYSVGAYVEITRFHIDVD